MFDACAQMAALTGEVYFDIMYITVWLLPPLGNMGIAETTKKGRYSRQ